MASSCHWPVSRGIAAADSPAPVPGNGSRAGAKSPLDSPCRYNSGSTSAICGDLRAHAGKIADENRCRSPVSGSTRLSLTRGARTVTPALWNREVWCRTRGGQHLAFAVIPVAHHQPIPVLVDQVGEPLDVGGDLRPQGGREHLPGSVANNLIQQRTTRIALIGRIRVVNYREHGRTFPTSASTPVLFNDLFP